MLLDDDEDLAAAEDPAPEPPETAVSALGDVWVMGTIGWHMATPATLRSTTG
jgi:hypothetical protein